MYDKPAMVTDLWLCKIPKRNIGKLQNAISTHKLISDKHLYPPSFFPVKFPAGDSHEVQHTALINFIPRNKQ